jgi:hypothetical protein
MIAKTLCRRGIDLAHKIQKPSTVAIRPVPKLLGPLWMGLCCFCPFQDSVFEQVR